jgi:hypothetical protein
LNEFELFQNLINFIAGPQVSSLSLSLIPLLTTCAAARCPCPPWLGLDCRPGPSSTAVPRVALPTPPPPFPLSLFPPGRARDTCLFFYHCCPAQAHGASATPPPLSFNQAARWVRASRFVVLRRSFSPGTPRARSILTFPRHLRTAPLDTATVGENLARSLLPRGAQEACATP